MLLASGWPTAGRAEPCNGRAHCAAIAESMQLRTGEPARPSPELATTPADRAAAALALDRIEGVSRSLTPRWHPSGGATEISVLPFSPSYSVGFSIRLATP
jgi:hypothetical protein